MLADLWAFDLRRERWTVSSLAATLQHRDAGSVQARRRTSPEHMQPLRTVGLLKKTFGLEIFGVSDSNKFYPTKRGRTMGTVVVYRWLSSEFPRNQIRQWRQVGTTRTAEP
jgi:hypothetical protein